LAFNYQKHPRTSFSFLLLDWQAIKKSRHVSITNAGRETFQIKNSLGPTDLRSFESNTVQPESRTLSRITWRTITENSSPSRLKTKHEISYSNRKGKLIMGSSGGFRVTMLIRTHSIVLKIKLSIQTRREHMCFFNL
jgi:hypothetical protein